ncbi:DMT family transporter [Oricola indica]|jgi:drug/metabolite transporter (DMT)-like permease|uniref:DMT family transporter n=1 Tax=Oricola indica TaxID=2872591 RepID=UPI001CBD4965|nr:DMT family transporter [Oricola indica]
MPPVRTTMSPVEWGMLIALSLLWGGSFFFNGVAVKELPPLTIVFARVALAAATLHIVLAATGRRLPGGREVWLAFAGMGILNNAIPFTLIVWGQGQIASGVASILNATTPLFTVLVAHGFTAEEKLTPLRGAGVIAGFAGVAAMLAGPDLSVGGAPVAAYVACLGAALSYGCAGVFGRRFRVLGVPPLSVATGQLTMSSLTILPLMLLADRPWTLALPGAETLLALIGLATVSTALAYILFFRILAGAGATNISLVTFLIPPSAILLGILFLGETLEPRHVAGMALIGLGLALVDGRLVRRWRRADA